MTDLLIKGMEMPKTCQICRAARFDRIVDCSLWQRVRSISLDKHRNCPLVEVPTPHGRLIDADEMASDEADAYLSAQITIATTGNKDDEQEALMTINDMVHKKLQMLLKDAPTVIEAEK